MAIFIKKIIIVYLHSYMLGARGHILHEKILKIWCSLVRFGEYIAQIVSRKINIFLHVYKNNYYSYSFIMRLVIATGNIFGKTCHN